MALTRQTLAVGLVSALFGASAVLAYRGKEMDQLSFQFQKCDTERSELQDQNHLLSLKLEQPNTESVIQSIHVEASAPDNLSRIQVIQLVMKELDFLKNRPLNTLEVNPDLPNRLLDGRTITVNQQILTLHVNTVVVVPKLFIVVTASVDSRN